MRYLRYAWHGQTVYGVEQDGGVLPVMDFTSLAPRDDLPAQPLEALRLVAPCQPTKIVVVGRNYEAHARESGREVPDEPMICLKPSTAVIGPGEPIVYPRLSTRVDPEAELAVVIGTRTRRVRPEDAERCIVGYTCFNDVTARDLQRKDVQWTRGKGFDTFAPIGPWIVPGIQPADRELRCLVNGEVRQRSDTSQMHFSVPFLVSFVSHVMTLLPGDVIATGTPEGIAPIRVGDEVTIEIEGIGALTNRVELEREQD